VYKSAIDVDRRCKGNGPVISELAPSSGGCLRHENGRGKIKVLVAIELGWTGLVAPLLLQSSVPCVSALPTQPPPVRLPLRDGRTDGRTEVPIPAPPARARTRKTGRDRRSGKKVVQRADIKRREEKRRKGAIALPEHQKELERAQVG